MLELVSIIILTFCMLGGVPEAGEVADDPLDMEELESFPLPP